MTRLIVSMWTTLDGYVAGLDDSMSWLRADADLMDYEINLVESAGALLLGRITHTDFASYWPLVAAGEIESDEGNKRYASRLDQLDKFVVSRSGDIASWPGTQHLRDATAAEIRDIKDRSDGDVIIYGSLSLVSALNQQHLIDEFHLIVNPMLLCQGKPLLDEAQTPTELELIDSRPFSSGAVLLKYRVVSAREAVS